MHFCNVSGKTKEITTNDPFTVSCAAGVISVGSGYYGREGVCESPTATTIFTSRCDGKSECIIKKSHFNRCGDLLGREMTIVIKYRCTTGQLAV